MKYQEGNDLKYVANAFGSFFKNQEAYAAVCPVTSCTLLQKGCKNKFTESHIQIVEQSKGNFTIMAKVNNPFGFNDVLCISCTNGNSQYPRQTITHDNFRVQLPSKCLSSLYNEQVEFQPVIIKHDRAESLKGKEISRGYLDFFYSADQVNCPIAECVLKEKGCQEQYTR